MTNTVPNFGLNRTLGRAGLSVIRVRGGHHYVRHPDGRSTVVAVHRGETIGVGLMGKILRDVEVTTDQFIEFL